MFTQYIITEHTNEDLGGDIQLKYSMAIYVNTICMSTFISILGFAMLISIILVSRITLLQFTSVNNFETLPSQHGISNTVKTVY